MDKKFQQYGRDGLHKLVSIKKSKTTLPKTEIDEGNDPCPVCDENLFYTDEYTKRIAVLDDYGEVTGWICPQCFTEFNMLANVKILFSKESVQGET